MAQRKSRKTRSGKNKKKFSILRFLFLLAGVFVVLCLLLVLPWRWLTPPVSAFMLADAFDNGAVAYHWRDIEQISPQLAIAVIASEDQKFPFHHGFDIQEIRNAMVENRGVRRGASTISQQVAKNLFLWRGRSYMRKGIEAILTLIMEMTWSKKRILEVYLNIAEFAPATYGAEAAALRVYGQKSKILSSKQASLLAAVLPNPRQLDAAEPSDYVRARAKKIQRQTQKLGGITYLQNIK